MRKVLAIVLLIFSLMRSKVTMALAKTGAARTARPQQQAQNLPAWLQGAYPSTRPAGGNGNGGGNTPAEPARGTYRTGNAGNSNMTDVLKNKSAVVDRTIAARDGSVVTAATRYNPTGTPAPSLPAWLSGLFNSPAPRKPTAATRYDPANLGGYKPDGSAPAQTGYGGTNPNPEVTQGTLRGTNQEGGVSYYASSSCIYGRY